MRTLIAGLLISFSLTANAADICDQAAPVDLREVSDAQLSELVNQLSHMLLRPDYKPSQSCLDTLHNLINEVFRRRTAAPRT